MAALQILREAVFPRPDGGRCDAVAFCLLALLFAGFLPASAAVVRSRAVEVSIQGEGYVEKEDLLVEIRDKDDVKSWSRIPIPLDDHISLEASKVEVLGEDGRVVDTVPRRKYEKVESPGWELHSSGKVLLVPVDGLRIGQSLRISVTTEHHPPFSGLRLPLVLDELQERLQVKVTGAPSDLRWTLRGDSELFRISEGDGRLSLVGEGLEGHTPEPWSPSSGSQRPALLMAWGGSGDWVSVGTWYEGFKGDVERGGGALSTLAKELTMGLTTSRERVEALTAYVKRNVRYEAVEIGEGGWKPTPGPETLARGWGDCKDKSELLLGLLQEVGISGHLALVRAGYGEFIEREFPTALQFNHAIVALPATQAGAADGDPVADGFLFIDPTVERGAVQWLSPFSGGRPVLVVDGARSRLVDTPVDPSAELRVLRVEGRVDEAGTLEATLLAEYRGQSAVRWIRQLQTSSRDRTLERLQRLVHAVAPGAVLESSGWKEGADAVPSMILKGTLRLENAVRGEAGRRWLRLGAFTAFPDPGDLEDRVSPVALSPGTAATSWTLSLPEGWCPPSPRDESVENEIGAFALQVTAGPEGALTVERRLSINTRVVAAQDIEPLQVLALAEHRAGKRRIRLRCEPATTAGR